MKIFKNIIYCLIFTLVLIFASYYIYENYFKDPTTILKYNDYSVTDNFLYFESTNDFSLKNKKQILNVLYTIINKGAKEVTLTCNRKYTNCISDINKILNNNELMTQINNFVHPYNKYSLIKAEINNRKITLKIDYKYSQKEILSLNNKVNSILEEITDSTDSIKEKIIKVHNYIINNSNYPKDYNQETDYMPDYSKASGNLLSGIGVCGGYADSMSLFLYKLGVKNYQVSSDIHIWNVIFLDDKIYHIDLTWDDPISNDGSDMLKTTYLLIENEAFKKMNIKDHNFDKEIYLELN